MFETLDHINWNELETYNIDAREVPGLIRDLVSPYYETYNRADLYLTMILFAQGSDCEALPAVMPFTDVEREVMQQTMYKDMDSQVIFWLGILPTDRYIAATRPFLENLSEDDARWFLRRVERFLTRVFKPRTVPNPLRTKHPQGGFSYVYKPAAERRSVDGLSPLEREALRIVLDLDALWRTQHNLLEAYGFFDPSEALRRALR